MEAILWNSISQSGVGMTGGGLLWGPEAGWYRRSGRESPFVYPTILLCRLLSQLCLTWGTPACLSQDKMSTLLPSPAAALAALVVSCYGVR